MDTKNIIAAISLSIAIIVLWSLFFQPVPDDSTGLSESEKKLLNSSDMPTIDNEKKDEILSRNDALQLSERIYFENESIKGSISLKGAAIDDLTFKKFKEKLESDEKVVLLNPKDTSLGYYVESGWVTSNKNIDLPNNNSLWKVDGNSKLSEKNDVKIIWENKQGLIFEKIISIDNQYLFTVKQNI